MVHKIRKHTGFQKYVPVDNALKKFFSNIAQTKISQKTESLGLSDVSNRVLASDLASPLDLPPFERAAMDGYAVVSNDTTGASTSHPVVLEVVGTVHAGEANRYKISSGNAVAIATGAKIPKGADAVVMVEYTSLEKVNSKVKIFREIGQGKNVAVKGEDVKKGQILLRKGTWLSPQDIGMIASVGISKVPVFRKPKVAIFSTGNELVQSKSMLGEGSVFESNRHMLSSMVRDCGGEVIDLGICIDDKKIILTKLKQSLKYDMVVVSGGSSVGKKDFVPEIINILGKPGVIIHGVAMRPGSPTALSVINNTPVISAPGYPVSAFFAFYTFGRPLLFKMLKSSGKLEGKIIAKMASAIKLHEGMRTFVRVNLVRKNHNDADYIAKPVSAAGAAMLSTLTKSNGLIIVENKKKLNKGQKVHVIPLRNMSRN